MRLKARRNAVAIDRYRKYVLENQALAFTSSMHAGLLRHMSYGSHSPAHAAGIVFATQANNYFPFTASAASQAVQLKHSAGTDGSTDMDATTTGTDDDDNPVHHDVSMLDEIRRPSTIRDTLRRLCAVTKPKKKPGPQRQGAKKAKAMERLQSKGHVLDTDEATGFRALSARGNFLAQDRVDISFSSKELCREFAQPTRKSYDRLKRMGRFLIGAPRLLYDFNFADDGPAEYIEVYSDTDFAGCKESRRSTSGGVATINGHCIKHWSKTQTTVSLSSGEAELHGIGAAIAQGLGLQAICKDLGFTYKIRVHSDATAALGIARRRGLGKVRHLDCADLWVQEKVRTGAVTVAKILGSENPADVLTKYVSKDIMDKALKKLGLRYAGGRAKAAPETMGIQAV